MTRTFGAVGALAFVLAACTAYVWAEPASGVTPTLLARGTYEPFKVKTGPHSPVDFEAKAKSHVDVVVRQHDYIAGGSTGWHMHPGPVFITVKSGSLTFYEADDPTCTGTIVYEGEGYVDDGGGHMARNESGMPATDISVILAPVGQPFRTDLPARANPYCEF